MIIGTQAATRSSSQPLGGASGDLRHRFLRFHAPLALASAAVLALFMGLLLHDPSMYPHVDIFSGTLPKQRVRGAPMDHAPPTGQTARTDHGGDHTGRMGHDEDRTARMDHGGNRAGRMNHGGQRAPMDHDGEEAQSTYHGGDHVRPMRHGGDSFLGRSVQPLTVATGYIALGLLAITLLIGPANLLLRRRNPVSNCLRRDVGVWTAIFSVVHVIFGLQVHGSGRLRDFLNFFIAPDGRLRLNSFGLGNWTGLAALVIVVGLLAISSDLALRKIRGRPWKWLQRLNYVLFALVIAHAFFYGALLRMTSPFTLLLGFSVSAVLVGQAVGVWLWRRRYLRTARAPSGDGGLNLDRMEPPNLL